MPAPTQLIEALADRYRVERELGTGGMATVYLAHDLRHDRNVAVKVLRPELSAILGAGRFLAEIKTTANLQHPHILPLHDSGEAGGMVFYVMPFIEGQSLRDRLNLEKQLPVDEAVRIGREVAEALDYAHRHGVIHRDIKPENILLHDGRALVADFGIALAVSRTDGHTRMTETGMSLGTPFYMSPEQAMGEREITARSDVYALGCVLYEMLTGEPPFTGHSAQAIIARVMTEQPRSITLQRHTVPPHVEAAVNMALEKLPADRFATAAQFAEALAKPGMVTRPIHAVAGIAVGRGQSWKTIGLRVAPALLLGLGLGWLARKPPVAPVMRLQVALDKTRPDGGMDLSPDGTMLAFVATDSSGPNHLYLRRFDRLESQALPAAGTATAPVFSPDGQQIAYLDPPTTLRRISVLGSPPVTVSDSAAFAGLNWSKDGWIYFVNAHNDLARIPATGGPIEILPAQDSAGVHPGIFTPYPLPNGKGILIGAAFAGGGYEVQVLDLATHRLKTLVQGLRPTYAEPGRLLYVTADGTLFEAPFDQDRMVLTGPAEQLGTGLYSPLPGWVDFAISRTGMLVYLSVAGTHVNGLNFVTVDRAGKEQVLPIPPVPFDALALSPDGRRVAAEVIHDAGDGGDIVTFGLGDSVVTRLTFRGLNRYPAWSPDGRRVAFSQFLDGQRDLVWKPADGSGQEETLLKRPGPQFEVDFSRDGRWMVYRDGDANGGARGLGLRYRSMTPGGPDSVFYDGLGADIAPALSPDGHWLAYASDESGHLQIYVRPFPPQSSGAVWQVSTIEGSEPVWSRSGGELFYKEGNWLMAAEVKTSPSFSVIARRQLFSIARYNSNAYHARYAVLPGDQRFLMDRAVETSSPIQPVVVFNWQAGLGRK